MEKKETILTGISFNDFPLEDLKFIYNIYHLKSETLFLNKKELTKSNTGKWNELVYCILAGTQFPVTKLKPIFQKLLDEHYDIIDLLNIGNNIDHTMILAKILKEYGYRYHTQKSKVIYNSALFLTKKYNADISLLIKNNNSDYLMIREVIINNIKGIGIKIANHWLRNVGFDLCTIDIHLRRFLVNLNIANDFPEKAINNSNFILLEQQFHQLSRILEIDLAILQYSIWEYTRDYCVNCKCIYCPLQKRCNKGKDIYHQQNQLNLFNS
jgi:thermostable 8-oxoguanine DNA glycosylase